MAPVRAMEYMIGTKQLLVPRAVASRQLQKGGETLSIASVHFPGGRYDDGAYKLSKATKSDGYQTIERSKRLYAERALEAEPDIVLGDFNAGYGGSWLQRKETELVVDPALTTMAGMLGVDWSLPNGDILKEQLISAQEYYLGGHRAMEVADYERGSGTPPTDFFNANTVDWVYVRKSNSRTHKPWKHVKEEAIESIYRYDETIVPPGAIIAGDGSYTRNPKGGAPPTVENLRRLRAVAMKHPQSSAWVGLPLLQEFLQTKGDQLSNSDYRDARDRIDATDHRVVVVTLEKEGQVLKVATINVQFFLCNVGQMRLVLTELGKREVDVLAVQESWYSEATTQNTEMSVFDGPNEVRTTIQGLTHTLFKECGYYNG